ncbi:MAG: hypothetical protein V1744_07740 [Candidatus Altiarchaeota archaeon]
MGLFTWQLGVFNMGGSTVTSTGFAKLKPQLAGTGLEYDGKFTAVFTNGIGARIYVKSVEITSGGVTCYGELTSSVINPGDNFQVRAKNCIQGYSGSVYNVNVAINYDAEIGGQTISHTDSGTIRGPFEGSSGSYSGSRGYESSWGYGGIDGLHKSFDFGIWWIVVIAMSIIYVMEVHTRLDKFTKSTTIQLLAVYAFIFLICSTFICIFGFDHLFNTKDNPEIMLRLRYGWLIESTIYFIIGVVLLALSEYNIRREDKLKTTIVPVTRPLITLLSFSLVFIYPFRAIAATLQLTSETKLSEFGWTLEVLILIGMAVTYLLVNRKFAESAGEWEPPEIFYYAKNIAILYFILAAGFFIWGVNTLVYSVGELDFRGLLVALFMTLGGAVFLKVNIKAKPKEPQEGRVDPQPAGGGGHMQRTISEDFLRLGGILLFGIILLFYLIFMFSSFMFNY